MAAQSTIDMVKKKRKFYLRDNIDSTINIVNACNKFNIEKLIFSSSAAVYKKGQNKLKQVTLMVQIWSMISHFDLDLTCLLWLDQENLIYLKGD